MKKIAFILLLFLIACSKAPEVEDPLEEYSGIKISKPELVDGEKVHDIFNFDNETKIVNVTTFCLDQTENVIDTSDSYIMELPPESVSGWRPRCPDNSGGYKIEINEI